MLYKHWIIIINYSSFLFILSNQQIIHNPIISDKEFNPINYIIIPQNRKVRIKSSLTLTITYDFVKLFHESYLFSQSLFLCIDESNNFFLFLNDKYYNVELSSEKQIERISFKKNLKEGVKYLGYITCLESTYNYLNINIILYHAVQSEIIIYGQLGKKIYFYYLLKDDYYTFTIEKNDEQLISCKLLIGSLYICIFSINNDIEISIFGLLKSLTMRSYFSETVNKFKGYENAILYDTSDLEYKILCAKKKILIILNVYQYILN